MGRCTRRALQPTAVAAFRRQAGRLATPGPMPRRQDHTGASTAGHRTAALAHHQAGTATSAPVTQRAIQARLELDPRFDHLGAQNTWRHGQSSLPHGQGQAVSACKPSHALPEASGPIWAAPAGWGLFLWNFSQGILRAAPQAHTWIRWAVLVHLAGGFQGNSLDGLHGHIWTSQDVQTKLGHFLRSTKSASPGGPLQAFK